MVTGKEFIWGHLGKTGGNSTKHMFDVISRVVVEFDEVWDPKKHEPFKVRENKTGSIPTKRILNIRTLPEWIISRSMHTKTYEGIEFTKDDMLNGLIHFKDGSTVTVDSHLAHYEPEKVDYWFRTEYLGQDFIDVMSNFTNISPHEKKKILSIRKNQNAKSIRKAKDWFSKNDLQRLYDNCPLWTEYELKMYGKLMI